MLTAIEVLVFTQPVFQANLYRVEICQGGCVENLQLSDQMSFDETVGPRDLSHVLEFLPACYCD
jgi:hypothetical protein